MENKSINRVDETYEWIAKVDMLNSLENDHWVVRELV